MAGNDRQFPNVVPEQGDFRMYRSTAIIEAASNHLERFRAYAPNPVIQDKFEGNKLVSFDVPLKLLYAFVGK